MTAYVAVWLVVSGVMAIALFLTSERTVDVASHEATLRPDQSGSRGCRRADVALITYREGRPVGIQGVHLQTNGALGVDEYAELTYGSPGE